MRTTTKIFCAIVGLFFIGVAFWGGSRIAAWRSARARAAVADQAQQEAARVAIVTSATSTPSDQVGFNLAVPFISQAPRKNWDADHEEYCEEASLLMVAAFKQGARWTIDEQETQLAALRDWQKKTFGYFESVTVDEMVRVAREYFKFQNVRVIDNPTYEQLRTELSAGRPVVIPAAGRELGNPFFSGKGPPYHVLVLRGITPTDDFITNDPGTRRGENYVYKRAVLMNTIHDYRYGAQDKKVADGTARAIVIE